MSESTETEAMSVSTSSKFDTPFVVIDKSSNQLMFFRGERWVATLPVATGKTSDLTPTGEFRIVVKGVFPDWYNRATGMIVKGGTTENPLGSRWMGLDVPGTDGYYYGIHGTNNEESIGRYITEGCIRMANNDVEWLYDQVPLGTSVLIVDRLVG